MYYITVAVYETDVLECVKTHAGKSSVQPELNKNPREEFILCFNLEFYLNPPLMTI